MQLEKKEVSQESIQTVDPLLGPSPKLKMGSNRRRAVCGISKAPGGSCTLTRSFTYTHVVTARAGDVIQGLDSSTEY